MTEDFWLKTAIDDAGSSDSPYLSKGLVNTSGNKSTNSHEVFRNNTTAVEVIVKEVKKKNKIDTNKRNLAVEELNDRLYEDVEHLRRQLNKANKNLEDAKKCFRLVTFEMGKQLEAANQRELKTQTKYLVQQLEKEKLKTMLESKTNLVRKLRKELLSIKRIIKLVIKGIRCVPLSESALPSDLEYIEFESDMKMKLPKTLHLNMSNDHEATYESTLSSKV